MTASSYVRVNTKERVAAATVGGHDSSVCTDPTKGATWVAGLERSAVDDMTVLAAPQPVRQPCSPGLLALSLFGLLFLTGCSAELS